MPTPTAPQPANVLPPPVVNPPASLPANLPVFAAAKHPCRCSILGMMHTTDELQKLVAAAPGVSDELKAVVAKEISSKTTNAAQVDLHVVDHANGDSSIHIHVKAVKLG